MSRALASRIGLGTVQFGLDYGITNQGGRVPETEAAAILGSARSIGIETLDTAHLYGDSEAVLGRIACAAADFQMVTKTPKFADEASADAAVTALRNAFDHSLGRLQRTSVHALLFHDADDLLGPYGPSLWAAMRGLRKQGLVRKVGVSVYDGSQIEAALEYDLDLVQLPINPLDRRLIEGGQLARLAERGVEIHARSLFLQGLILADPATVPKHLAPLRAGIADLHERFSAAHLTPLEGIFGWAQALPIHRFIVGVTSVAELQDIASAAEKAQRHGQGVDLAGAPSIDPVYLNPARWPALAAASPDAT